jgi:hypothetical protein
LASASSSPSEIASGSPSASASAPVDAATAFVARLTAFAFAARSTIAGELDVGSARYAVSGTLDVAGGDQHSLLSIKAPGRQPVETIYQSGVLYNRTASGPWHTRPPTLHDSDLTSFFRSMKAVTDAGVETKEGRTLHHLTLPEGVTLAPSVFGVSDPSMSGVAGAVEFWAGDDGAPAFMSVHDSWTQTVAGSPVDGALVLDFTFSAVDTVVAIERPDEVWVTYTSKIVHMSFGYPDDWYLYKNRKQGTYRYDEVVSPATAFAAFYRYSAGGNTLNQIVAYIRTNPNHEKGFHVDSTKTVKMAGLTGRQIRIHATFKGKKQYWVYTLVLRGNYIFEVAVFDNKGHEADDLERANEFIATVVLTK